MAEAKITEPEVSSGGEDDGLCEYERRRLENIRKNHNMLRSLGLPLPAKPKLVQASTKRGGRRGRGGRKTRRKKKKAESDSDSSFKCNSESSSEDEWEPSMEQTRRKPRGRADEKIGPLDAQSKQKIFNAAKTAIKAKLNTLKEGRKKKKVVCGDTKKEKKKRSKAKGKAEKIEALFQSSDEEEGENKKDFAGFTTKEVEECFEEVCKTVPSARKQQWEALFGKDDEEENEEEFKGFTMEEVLSTEAPERSKSVTRCTREKARVDYREAVISDDDEYLFCEDCQELHHGDCPIHGALIPLPDIGSDESSKEFTKLPVPAQLTVKASSIPRAGLGVFATQDIARGVRFGPYVGKKVPASDVDEDTVTSYMWEIKQDGVKAFYTDGGVEETSNWLRFINCARNEEEQNLLAFQFKGHIYYRTFKAVYPGNELLVWYGEEYAKDLGISVEYTGDQASHTCKGCGGSFVEKLCFEIHLRHSKQCAEVNPRTYKCGKCQRIFSELTALQTHIRRHLEYEKENSERRPPKFNPSELDQSFYDDQYSSSKSIQKKKRGGGMVGSKSHECQYCGKTSKSAANLRKHIRIHTGERPFQCSYCDKAFNQEGSLKTHIRIHTGDKPFKCSYCEKSFNQECSLKLHIRTHTGDRPFQCSYCDKSFNQDGNLKKHIRIHTGDKPFQCSYCEKSFNREGNLKTHIRTHTGDRPYQCSYCNKSFSVEHHLKTHIRTHTGDRPYQCPQCGDSFAHSGNLKSHIQRKHS